MMALELELRRKAPEAEAEAAEAAEAAVAEAAELVVRCQSR